MRFLVTGCAGFIGSHLVDKLLSLDNQVIGVDNFNDFYDPQIKENNLSFAKKSNKFKLLRVDILDTSKLRQDVKNENIDKIIHLAARAGVRPSIRNPQLYTEVNVQGTVNLLRLACELKVGQFVYGSTSSVYGASKILPFAEDDPCDKIISPYGASKRSAEFFVESFYKTYGLKSAILRFFTVYGPRGRPDMAPAIFTKAILDNLPILKFGGGQSSRDYTYIDDIVDGVICAINMNLDFEIINLGNNHPVLLNDFIKVCESVIGKKALIQNKPTQIGDVEKTWANIVKAKELLGWQPKTKLVDGLKEYIQWLKIR